MKEKIFFEKKIERTNKMKSYFENRIKDEKEHLEDILGELKDLVGRSVPMVVGNKNLEVTQDKTQLALIIQDLLVAKRSIENRIARFTRVYRDIGSPRLFELLDDAQWNRNYQIGIRQP